MDDEVAEELAEIHEKQRQQTEDSKNTKIWTRKGISKEASPIGPLDYVLPFGFAAAKPFFQYKMIEHVSSIRGVACERDHSNTSTLSLNRKSATSHRFP